MTTNTPAALAAEIRRLATMHAEAFAKHKRDDWADFELIVKEQAMNAAIDRMRDALAAAHEHIAEIQAAYEATETERQLTVHKVITCSVAARDPVKASQGVYANEWDSPQAEEVRKLRADRDRLAALASCAKQWEPANSVEFGGIKTSAPAAVAPDGWVTVPRVATPDMCVAAWDHSDVAADDVEFSEIYAAMIAAAPPVPEAEGLLPCRGPYCECDQGQCMHPGFYDARHLAAVESTLLRRVALFTDPPKSSQARMPVNPHPHCRYARTTQARTARGATVGAPQSFTTASSPRRPAQPRRGRDGRQES